MDLIHCHSFDDYIRRAIQSIYSHGVIAFTDTNEFRRWYKQNEYGIRRLYMEEYRGGEVEFAPYEY